MKEQYTQRKTLRRNDLLLIAALLLIALIGIVYLFFFRESGNTVKVTVDGELYGVYSLDDDQRVEIKSDEQGEKRNLLVIQDGKAYMETASCPDFICVSHHKIFRDGESIVCLPNRVVVTVTKEKGDAPDIIA